MSWIPTLAGWQWIVLAAVPALIVLMYFLKLRREPVEVPSTYLWARTLEDLHVNSLLQRLRRNLLLLLQLLAVLLAFLALMRPGVRGEAANQSRLVFMLDRSASMRATDVENDPSRFEMARRLIGQRIDAMQDHESAMLIAFDNRADLLQSFTSDRRRLRDALSRCQVSQRTTDIAAALHAADSLAGATTATTVGEGSDDPGSAGQPGDAEAADAEAADAEAAEGEAGEEGEQSPASRVPPAELLLYSDGAFSSAGEVVLENLVPNYVAIGKPRTTNLAISAFSAQRNSERPSELQTFATVVNLGATRASTTATLSIGGELIDAAAVDLEPGEQTGVTFTLERDQAVAMTLTLDIDDDLSLDNQAFAALSPLRAVSVLLVTSGNHPLELALGTFKASKICNVEIAEPSYLESKEYLARAAASREDLVIFDRCSPPILPATNTFFIGALPPGEWSWASEPQPVVLIDADRTHPLMRYVEMLSLMVFQGRAVAGPPGTTELVGADVGSVLAITPRDGFQDLVLGFEVVSQADDGTMQINTNWYAERSWPVFVLNVLKFLAGAAEASAADSYQPGETVRLRVDTAADQLKISRQGGDERTVPTSRGGTAQFTDTDVVGNYRVQAGEQLAEQFTVNLFDRRESTLATADEIKLGYVTVQASEAAIQQRREYWRPLLLLMLGILATEWWLYAKRLG